MKSKRLPQPYQFLEKYIDWAEPNEAKRLEYRENLSMEDIREFYDAMAPHAPAVLEYFKAVEAKDGSTDQVSLETRNLFVLMQALSDAALSVELHKSPTVPNGMPWDMWKPEHETPGWKRKPKVRLFPKAAAS
ncbi:MAG: hypothetical protein IPP50_16345 [Piscinibacter sp.]|nr:hypothetical protein [Piscinibacter sp.]